MWSRADALRGMALGAPGALRDRLNALVLSGRKCVTAGSLTFEYAAEGESVEVVGERQALLDGDGAAIAIIEITRVDIIPFADIEEPFVRAEGEAFHDVEHWQRAHRAYYAELGHPVADDEPFVCLGFRVVQAV